MLTFADFVILALPGAALFVLTKLTKASALIYKRLFSIGFFFHGQLSTLCQNRLLAVVC
jgi:hypothetical protein